MAAEIKFFQAKNLLWILVGAVLYLSFGYTEMQGSDLWWHVAAGREIMQKSTLWLSDSWSYTVAGATWMNHEWLTDLLYYFWVSLWGMESLVYWKWLVVILTYIILQLTLIRTSHQYLASLVCAGLAAAVAAPFIDVRPHLYSLLCFTILISMLLNRTPSLWKLALLFVVWVNLHGGFIFGLMALSILVFPWRDMRVATLGRPALIVCVCTLACLVNPDGINSFLLPLTYALDSDSPFRQLAEWLPPFQSGGMRSPLFVWLLAATPLIALSYAIPFVRKSTDVPWEGLALCALTVLMALTSRRFIPLFSISWAVMSAPLIGLLFRELKAEKANIVLALLALCYAVFRLLPYPLSAGPAYHYLTAEYSYPIDMINYVEANEIQGNIFAFYNWGGYIHWRTDGKLKVFIDGRANTVYSDEIYNQYVAVLSSKSGWLDIIESSEADYFLWPYHIRGTEKFQAMMTSGRWQVVYQDSVSYLLARNSVRLPERSKPSLATPYRILSAAHLNALRGNWTAAAVLAERVLQQIPYQKGACTLATRAQLRLGNSVKSEEILTGCRRYFPSNQLR